MTCSAIPRTFRSTGVSLNGTLVQRGPKRYSGSRYSVKRGPQRGKVDLLDLDWRLPYPWPRKPVLAENIVATTQPLAAQAGLRMLLQGGNAVDAALAAAITLTLVEPVSNGIGSDLFAIVWDGGKLQGLNASGRAPARWSPGYFSGRKAMPERGWD